ncbi:hypothetical protein MF271_22785 (plasmid) [Deinococcus sp. KNUC1210]|uniref:hypothetical protein n=1 Tax=Deinococcus sp. KNUC1210 TaxID=2917691 RepID=UPI001EEFE2CF|nr:hypothetical protein [Deinococcus sp. KNUC1210]ULH18291.1 hypothetical protein MF271_22785 [Deinococcus sp. KNUC1210]
MPAFRSLRPHLYDRSRPPCPHSLLVAAGLLGLLLFPAAPPLPWVLLGTGCGGTFSLALILIVQRAHTPWQVP